MKKQVLLILTYFYLSLSSSLGQEKTSLQIPITLEEAIELANRKSLNAFKAKRQYAINYWKFKSFKARLLPKADLLAEPFTYTSSFIERYDPENNIDVYRLQQNINTFAELTLSQNIKFTGAKVFLNSSFNRLENFGFSNIENYNATPIRIGIFQPIMAYNELKWMDKTALLEFEMAKKEYIFTKQEINLEMLSLFFNWIIISNKKELAVEAKKNAIRLHEIGKKRYDLGSIQRDNLLNLELDKYTSSIELTKLEQELESVISNLQVYLDTEDLQNNIPVIPELIPSLKINTDEAFQLALKNNPNQLESEINKINAERDLDKAIKENRFDLSINASFGLNQRGNTFNQAYSDFLNQQLVSIRFTMPLLDWGERKGNIENAKMTKALNDIEIEQAENTLAEQLKLTVENFNLQENLVLNALRAKTISEESYTITQERFARGNVDLLNLLNSRNAWQAASIEYINSVQSFWQYYYEVRKLTLYDFINNSSLEADFQSILTDE
jgi:hypothetical protein